MQHIARNDRASGRSRGVRVVGQAAAMHHAGDLDRRRVASGGLGGRPHGGDGLAGLRGRHQVQNHPVGDPASEREHARPQCGQVDRREPAGRWRAFRFATFFGQLLRDHPGQVGLNVTWNIERGLELTAADLSRATLLRAGLSDRISQFFDSYDVLACPATQVAPFDVELDWVHEIDGVPQRTYLDWMASAYLISVTGLLAISVPAGFTSGGLPVGLQLVGPAERTGRCSASRTRSRPLPGMATWRRTLAGERRRRASDLGGRALAIRALPAPEPCPGQPADGGRGTGDRLGILRGRPQFAILIIGQLDLGGGYVALKLRDAGRAGYRNDSRAVNRPRQRDLRGGRRVNVSHLPQRR